jgi:hypothetical protein
MNDTPIGLQLGDLIYQILAFSYFPEQKRKLEEDFAKMPGSPNFEQGVAAAIS